jgi:hypothetical protein
MIGIERGDTGKALRVGNAFHKSLDLLANGMSREDAIAAIVRIYDEHGASEDQFGWAAYECAETTAMVAVYNWRYANSGLTVIASEINFEVPVARTGFTRRGFIDKIVRVEDPRPRLLIMEHKTSGSDIDPTGDYWRRLTIDHQLTGYISAARHMGWDVEGVLYDVIRKPGLSPRAIPALDAEGLKIVLEADGTRSTNKNGTWRQAASTWQTLQTTPETPADYADRIMAAMAEDPDRHFQRHEVARLDDEVARYEAETAAACIDMRHAYSMGTQFLYRNTGSCRAFNRACDYLPLCASHTTPPPASEGIAPPDGYSYRTATEESETP